LPSAPNTNHKNVSLAFTFLNRILEQEQEAIVGDGGYIIMSCNDFIDQCLNTHLDNYRIARSSALWIPDAAQSYNILLDGAAIRGQVEFCQHLHQWMWEESKQDSLLGLHREFYQRYHSHTQKTFRK
jgi:hypothetical protein